MNDNLLETKEIAKELLEKIKHGGFYPIAIISGFGLIAIALFVSEKISYITEITVKGWFLVVIASSFMILGLVVIVVCLILWYKRQQKTIDELYQIILSEERNKLKKQTKEDKVESDKEKIEDLERIDKENSECVADEKNEGRINPNKYLAEKDDSEDAKKEHIIESKNIANKDANTNEYKENIPEGIERNKIKTEWPVVNKADDNREQEVIHPSYLRQQPYRYKEMENICSIYITKHFGNYYKIYKEKKIVSDNGSGDNYRFDIVMEPSCNRMIPIQLRAKLVSTYSDEDIIFEFKYTQPDYFVYNNLVNKLNEYKRMINKKARLIVLVLYDEIRPVSKPVLETALTKTIKVEYINIQLLKDDKSDIIKL